MFGPQFESARFHQFRLDARVVYRSVCKTDYVGSIPTPVSILRFAPLKDRHSFQQYNNTQNSRYEQVGYLTRGSKVRTYNFIEDRVSDERCPKNFRLRDVMKGRLDSLYNCVASSSQSC